MPELVEAAADAVIVDAGADDDWRKDHQAPITRITAIIAATTIPLGMFLNMGD